MPRAVLHAGLPKTGTSAVQDVLRRRRGWLLRREGVLYPFDTPNPNTPLGTIFRDDPREQMANRGLPDEEVAARRAGYFEELEGEVRGGGWETLLLSGELVCNLGGRELARLRAWVARRAGRPVVLVWVRHPVDWSRSVVQQLLKAGGTLEGLCADPPVPDFRRRVGGLVAAFGRENVRVFSFEEAAVSEGGVVGAFARAAGIEGWARLASLARRKNESLSVEAMLELEALNRERPGSGRRELARLARVGGRRFGLPDAAKGLVAERSREDTAWLNRTFGLDLYPDVGRGP